MKDPQYSAATLKGGRVMIDIETLDTASTAVVVSIGMSFDSEDGIKSMQWNLAIGDQVKHGRTIGADTVDWWLKQDKTVWAANREGEMQPAQALRLFSDALFDLYRQNGDKLEIWANGITFDCVILESLCKTYAVPLPWKYWELRDARTIYALGKQLGVDSYQRKDNMAHGAWQDAEYQLRRLKHIESLLDTK